METRAILALLVICYITTANSLNIVSRSDWGAKSPKQRTTFAGKINYVIIHHTSQPPACYTTSACKAAIKSIQNGHMTSKRWSDIGYSFLIGADGNIYEGRGFNVVGSHAPRYNSKSVGICMIGDWSDNTPPAEMLNKLKDLIAHGVARGHIDSNYKLLGHHQVKATSCPGDALFNELKTWPNFSSTV